MNPAAHVRRPKTRGSASGGIPGPVSRTQTSGPPGVAPHFDIDGAARGRVAVAMGETKWPRNIDEVTSPVTRLRPAGGLPHSRAFAT
jgi:hypothetical protein